MISNVLLYLGLFFLIHAVTDKMCTWVACNVLYTNPHTHKHTHTPIYTYIYSACAKWVNDVHLI